MPANPRRHLSAHGNARLVALDSLARANGKRLLRPDVAPIAFRLAELTPCSEKWLRLAMERGFPFWIRLRAALRDFFYPFVMRTRALN